MDFSLTDDQIAFRQTARQFAQKELKPNAAEWDRTSHFPIDVIKNQASSAF